jgi:ABC-2 type transport system permease protein
MATAPVPIALLIDTDRPTPPSALAASLTFAWRALRTVAHVPEQALDVVGIPIVFTVLFTYLFGGALAGSTGDYLQFLLPGTLVMTVILLTMYTGVGLSSDRASGAFDRFRSMPVWRPSLVVGALIGDLGRYVVAAALVLALGTAMGWRPSGGVGGTVLAVGLVLVFASGLSWIWAALGLLVRTPTAVTNMGVLLLFPLTLASNTFVDPATTPGWLQAIIRNNPVSHVVSATRDLIDGTAAIGDATWSLLATATIVAVFAPLTMRLLTTRQ